MQLCRRTDHVETWSPPYVYALIVALIDARNVLRSRWPNIPEDELVELCRAWAEREGHEALIVFDGRAPEGGIGTGSESADDWIARHASELDVPYLLVTSDRELRARAGGNAERVIGGGSFVRELTGAGEP